MFQEIIFVQIICWKEVIGISVCYLRYGTFQNNFCLHPFKWQAPMSAKGYILCVKPWEKYPQAVTVDCQLDGYLSKICVGMNIVKK